MPGGSQTLLRKKIKQEFILHISFSHLKVLCSFLIFIHTILYASTSVLHLFPWADSDPYPPSFARREKRDCLAPCKQALMAFQNCSLGQQQNTVTKNTFLAEVGPNKRILYTTVPSSVTSGKLLYWNTMLDARGKKNNAINRVQSFVWKSRAGASS